MPATRPKKSVNMAKSPLKSPASRKKVKSKKPCSYYAVMNGRKKGIFLHWDDAKMSIEGFSANKHQGCSTIEEAEALMINEGSVEPSDLTVYESYSKCVPLKDFGNKQEDTSDNCNESIHNTVSTQNVSTQDQSTTALSEGNVKINSAQTNCTQRKSSNPQWQVDEIHGEARLQEVCVTQGVPDNQTTVTPEVNVNAQDTNTDSQNVTTETQTVDGASQSGTIDPQAVGTTIVKCVISDTSVFKDAPVSNVHSGLNNTSQPNEQNTPSHETKQKKDSCPDCEDPSEDYMIQCEVCEKWIHYGCTDLPGYYLTYLYLVENTHYCCQWCQKPNKDIVKLMKPSVMSKATQSITTLSSEKSTQTSIHEFTNVSDKETQSDAIVTEEENVEVCELVDCGTQCIIMNVVDCSTQCIIMNVTSDTASQCERNEYSDKTIQVESIPVEQALESKLKIDFMDKNLELLRKELHLVQDIAKREVFAEISIRERVEKQLETAQAEIERLRAQNDTLVDKLCNMPHYHNASPNNQTQPIGGGILRQDNTTRPTKIEMEQKQYNRTHKFSGGRDVKLNMTAKSYPPLNMCISQRRLCLSTKLTLQKK